MTRILVIEDNAGLARGLRNNLEVEGYEVQVVRTGTKGLAAARASRPDVIVLDLMLPEMDGFIVLQKLREDGFDMPVLILTARATEADKVRGFRFGADDYVTKPFGLLELLARIQSLVRRTLPATSGPRDEGAQTRRVERFADVVVDPAARTVHRGSQEVFLTATQFDLLLALIRRTGAVATRQELLKEVWGYHAEVMTRTVDSHIVELRRKLEKDPGVPSHIVTVRRIGYRFRA